MEKGVWKSPQCLIHWGQSPKGGSEGSLESGHLLETGGAMALGDRVAPPSFVGAAATAHSIRLGGGCIARSASSHGEAWGRAAPWQTEGSDCG